MAKEGFMNRLHALVIAVLLSIAAVAGSYAALGTTALGVSASEATVSDAQIAARKAKLDRAARTLRRAAKRKPPALPARRASGSLVSAAAAPGSGAPVAPAPGPAAFRDDDHDSDDDHDDDDDRDDDSHTDDDRDDDHSGHGRGGEDDD
jgi:hypothetical protein